jgi:hypothetical protein
VNPKRKAATKIVDDNRLDPAYNAKWAAATEEQKEIALQYFEDVCANCDPVNFPLCNKCVGC